MVAEPLAPAPEGVDSGDWVAACAAVRSYCGWHVAPSVSEEVTVDGSGGSVQLLPTLHLTALASITADGLNVADPEWSESGIVRGVCSRRLRGVVAQITHGYAECPGELLAVISAAASRRSATRAALSGVAVKQVGQVQYVTAADATGPASSRWDGPAHEVAILDRFALGPRP